MGAADLYTLADIAEEVALNYGSADTQTLERAKKWVNRALDRMEIFGDWPFQESLGDFTIVTNSNNNEYILDPSIKKVTSLYLHAPQRKLFLINTRQFRKAIPNEFQARSSMTHYRITGYDGSSNAMKISLWPFPDGIYTIFIDAIKHIPLMEDDQDNIMVKCGIPKHLVHLVIDMATAISYRELDDDMYQNAYQEAYAALAQAYAEETTEHDDDMQFKVMDAMDPIKALDPILPPEFSD